MDGRVQLPIIKYLQNKFNVQFVDVITEPGPNLILAEQINKQLLQSILDRLNISIEKHHSVGLAIVGHHDCAGNPSSNKEQVMHIKKAVKYLRQLYGEIEIIGLWVDKNWNVNEII
jgi:MoaA/NifB/PqqE/SkfB family radical SAM enzyme